jgi:hypothetical protein
MQALKSTRYMHASGDIPRCKGDPHAATGKEQLSTAASKHVVPKQAATGKDGTAQQLRSQQQQLLGGHFSHEEDPSSKALSRGNSGCWASNS